MLTVPKVYTQIPTTPYTALRLGKRDIKPIRFSFGTTETPPTAIGISFSLKPLVSTGYFTLFTLKIVDKANITYKIDVALKDLSIVLVLHNTLGDTAMVRISNIKLNKLSWNTININWNKVLEKNWAFLVNGATDLPLSNNIMLEPGILDHLIYSEGVFAEDVALLGNLIVTNMPITKGITHPSSYRQNVYLNLRSVADAVAATSDSVVLDPWFIPSFGSLSQLVGSYDCATTGEWTYEAQDLGRYGYSLALAWIDTATGILARRFISVDNLSAIYSLPLIGEVIPKRFFLEVWNKPGTTFVNIQDNINIKTSRPISVRPFVANPFAIIFN